MFLSRSTLEGSREQFLADLFDFGVPWGCDLALKGDTKKSKEFKLFLDAVFELWRFCTRKQTPLKKTPPQPPPLPPTPAEPSRQPSTAEQR